MFKQGQREISCACTKVTETRGLRLEDERGSGENAAQLIFLADRNNNIVSTSRNVDDVEYHAHSADISTAQGDAAANALRLGT